ncbi:MAG: BamA/TamA family outer membrane protein [Candidatus Aminicenantes bacterium]|nr:BamA/TamA family outer membrane protein [Candidatus Aminicenantes bacterium]
MGAKRAAALGLAVVLGSAQALLGADLATVQVVVGSVEVQVDGRPAEPDIRELVPVRSGETFSYKRVTNAVKEIYRSGLFADIQVLRAGTDPVDLTFRLVRKVFVRRLDVVGDEAISPKRILSRVAALKPGGEFSEEKGGRAVEEARAALEREGFFAADVRLLTDRDPATNTVDVRFDVRSSRRFEIRRIAFVPKDGRVREESLKQMMESREGRAFVPSRFEADVERIKAFYVARGYRRAEVAVADKVFDPEERRVYLTVRVALNERIEIAIRGAKVPAGIVAPLWEERIYEDWGLSEGEARIQAYLRRRGYLFALVRSSIERTDGLVRVIHDVDAGPRATISRLSFVGADYFGEEGLKRELGLASAFSLFGVIDGDRLYALPREIELIYRSRGFSDPRVTFNMIREGSKVQVVFSIEEGPQQTIEAVQILGATLFSVETLRRVVRSRPGGPYFAADVQRDIEELETFYQNEGIRGTVIAVRVEEPRPNAFLLRFDIDEGQQLRVGRILFSGNRVTRRRTIERELRIREGDRARRNLILESKRRLENLGIFSEVKVEEVVVGPGLANLVVGVREGELNYGGVGVGLETKNAPKTFAVWDNVVRLRGTAEYIRTNMFGTAAQLSLVGQLSLKETRAVVSWEQPYLFGVPLETVLTGWVEREERTSYGFERRGISLTSVKPLSQAVMVLGTVRWDRTVLFDLEISESEVDREHVPYATTSLSTSFVWDRRDDSANPTRGRFLSGAVDWAFPLFKAESDYLKLFVKTQQIVPILADFSLALTGRLGLGMGRMPIHERFFGGGSNSFRGCGFEEMGPKDVSSGLPLGGKALILGNFEFRFPLLRSIPNLFGAAFFDAGHVWAKRKEVNLFGLETALGIGVRYRTPLGPVRFDLAWNLDAPEREGKPLAFITIGNVF